MDVYKNGNTLVIVDSQVYLWAANTPQRPWPVSQTVPHRAIPYSTDELLNEMDTAGVQRAVLVPPPWEGRRNDVVSEAARQHRERFAVMGAFDPEAPSAKAQITNWKVQPGMLGLRLHVKSREYFGYEWLWVEAAAAGVPLMMVADQHLREVGQVAERYPQVKLVMDHLGIPAKTKDDAAFVHLDQLLALAKYPNIAVKASALPCYTTEHYPYRRLHPYIRRVYDAFGSRRMFWGSDYSKLPCSYRQSITMFTEEIPWLTPTDKEWIMGRGLCEWIGWKLP